MADISTELARILSAIYGEDVRGSIHDAIEKINDVSEVVLTTGTAVTGPSSSSTGFYDDSLYLNTDTFELWKCTGVNTWASQGILKGEAGDDGNGIVSIIKTSTSGLVDTYTITYTDGTTSTFAVTNGADGTDGNDGNDGVSVTGVSLLSKVGLLATYRMTFSNGTYFDYTVSDGASGSGTGDMTKAVYDTDNDGIVDAAKTLSGLTATIADLNKTANLKTVATSGSYNDLSNKPTAGTGIAINNNVIAVDADNTPTENSEKPVKSKGVYSALESVEEEIEQIYADNGVLGAKNLWVPARAKGSNGGLTWASDEDGIITVTGQNTGQGSYYIGILNHLILPKGTYIFSGCPTNSLNMSLFVRPNSTTQAIWGQDDGDSPKVMTLTEDTDVIGYIHVGGGVNVGTQVFKPMITLASDTQSNYANFSPYAMTNRELTEAIANIVTDDWTTTRQVQSDGTVTFTGLNDSYSYSRPYYELPSGESAYTYSKVTKSGSGTSVTLTYTTDAPIGTVCKLRILK